MATLLELNINTDKLIKDTQAAYDEIKQLIQDIQGRKTLENESC